MQTCLELVSFSPEVGTSRKRKQSGPQRRADDKRARSGTEAEDLDDRDITGDPDPPAISNMEADVAQQTNAGHAAEMQMSASTDEGTQRTTEPEAQPNTTHSSLTPDETFQSPLDPDQVQPGIEDSASLIPAAASFTDLGTADDDPIFQPTTKTSVEPSTSYGSDDLNFQPTATTIPAEQSTADSSDDPVPQTTASTTPAEHNTAQDSVGQGSSPSVSADDVSAGVSQPDGDTTWDSHARVTRAMSRHDNTADDVTPEGRGCTQGTSVRPKASAALKSTNFLPKDGKSSKSLKSKTCKKVTPTSSTEVTDNEEEQREGSRPRVRADDCTEVTGNEEEQRGGSRPRVRADDSTEVTDDEEEQREGSSEQLRFERLRRNVHTLLNFIRNDLVQDFPDLGSVNEIEDDMQRVMRHYDLPYE